MEKRSAYCHRPVDGYPVSPGSIYFIAETPPAAGADAGRPRQEAAAGASRSRRSTRKSRPQRRPGRRRRGQPGAGRQCRRRPWSLKTPAKLVTVDTSKMTVALGDLGGGVMSVRLKEYKETVGGTRAQGACAGYRALSVLPRGLEDSRREDARRRRSRSPRTKAATSR